MSTKIIKLSITPSREEKQNSDTWYGILDSHEDGSSEGSLIVFKGDSPHVGPPATYTTPGHHSRKNPSKYGNGMEGLLEG